MLFLTFLSVIGILSLPGAFLHQPDHNGPKPLVWSARQLTFDDFQGKPPASAPWAASSSCSILFRYQLSQSRLTRCEVQAIFDPSKSWMIVPDQQVLRHEQLHFDITELYARKLYIEAARWLGRNVSTMELQDLFNGLNHQCDSVQQAYDAATHHGLLFDQQQLWYERIRALLDSIPPYP